MQITKKSIRDRKNAGKCLRWDEKDAGGVYDLIKDDLTTTRWYDGTTERFDFGTTTRWSSGEKVRKRESENLLHASRDLKCY